MRIENSKKEKYDKLLEKKIITREDVVFLIYEKGYCNGIRKNDIDHVLKEFFYMINFLTEHNKSVQLRGFGTFFKKILSPTTKIITISEFGKKEKIKKKINESSRSKVAFKASKNKICDLIDKEKQNEEEKYFE